MYRPRFRNQVANQPQHQPQPRQSPIQQDNIRTNRNYNQNGNFEMMSNFIGRGHGAGGRRGGRVSNYPRQNDFRIYNEQIEMKNFDARGGGRRGRFFNYSSRNGFRNVNQNEQIEMDNFNNIRGRGHGARGQGRACQGDLRWNSSRGNVFRPYQDNLPPVVNPNYVLRSIPNQQPIVQVEHSANRNFDHNFRGNNQGYRGRRGGSGGTIGEHLLPSYRGYRGNQRNQGNQGNVLSPINRGNFFHSYDRNHQNQNSNQSNDIPNSFSTLETAVEANGRALPFASYGGQLVLMSNGNYESYGNYRNYRYLTFYPGAQFTGNEEISNRNLEKQNQILTSQYDDRNSRTSQDSFPTVRNEKTLNEIQNISPPNEIPDAPDVRPSWADQMAESEISISPVNSNPISSIGNSFSNCHSGNSEQGTLTGGEIDQAQIITSPQSSQTSQFEQNVDANNQNRVLESGVVLDNVLELAGNQSDLLLNGTFANPNQTNDMANELSTCQSEQTIPKVIDAAATTRPNLFANGPCQPLVPPASVYGGQNYFAGIQPYYQINVAIQPNTNLRYFGPDFGPFSPGAGYPNRRGPNVFTNFRGQAPQPWGITNPRMTCVRCGEPIEEHADAGTMTEALSVGNSN